MDSDKYEMGLSYGRERVRRSSYDWVAQLVRAAAEGRGRGYLVRNKSSHARVQVPPLSPFLLDVIHLIFILDTTYKS